MSGAGGLEPLSRAETMAERAEDTPGPPPEKPPYSYVALITLVLEESPDRRLTLSSIYEAIQRRFPYYSRLEGKSWQNSIRHNLSLNECFIRLPRQPGQKGSHWALHPEYRDMFPQRDYRRRRRLAALPPFRYQLPPGHYPLISGPWRPGPPFYFTGPPPHLYPSQGEMPSPPYWDPELQYGAMVPTRMEVYPQHPLPPCGFRSLLSCEHDKEEVPTSSNANPDPLL